MKNQIYANNVNIITNKRSINHGTKRSRKFYKSGSKRINQNQKIIVTSEKNIEGQRPDSKLEWDVDRLV